MSVRVSRFRHGKKTQELGEISTGEWEKSVGECLCGGGVVIDFSKDGTVRVRLSEEAERRMAVDAKKQGITVQELLQRQISKISARVRSGDL